MSDFSTFQAQAFGRDDTHIDWNSLECPVHKALVAPLVELKREASAAGFDLRIASGYRDFARQQSIWNAKAKGLRPVLDNLEQPIVLSELNGPERVRAILRWSALPGSSRHHWGTEVDIYEGLALGSNALALTVAETQADGPFVEFYRWLDIWLASPGCAFFRPYGEDRGGVAPEPWHLSHRTLASRFLESYDFDALFALISTSDIALKDSVLAIWDEVCARFILNHEKRS